MSKHLGLGYLPGFTMRFEEVLQQHQRLERVGDVWLRFDSSLLIGETRSFRSAVLPALLAAAAVSLGLVAGLLALWPSGPWALGVLLGVLAAGMAYLAERHAFQRRYPRRFVLNFASETLRLEAPHPWLPVLRTVMVPFNDVAEVRRIAVAPDKPSGLELRLALAGSQGRKTFLLVRKVPARQQAELARLERMLGDALGVRLPPPEPAAPVVLHDESRFDPS